MKKKYIKKSLRYYYTNDGKISIKGKPIKHYYTTQESVVVGTQLRYIDVVNVRLEIPETRVYVTCLDDNFVIYPKSYDRHPKTTAELRYWSGVAVDERSEKISGRKRNTLPGYYDDVHHARRSKRGWKENTKLRKQWMVNLE